MWKYLNPFSILIQQATAVAMTRAIAISFQSISIITRIWQKLKNSIFEVFDRFLRYWIELWTRYCQSNHSKNHAPNWPLVYDFQMSKNEWKWLEFDIGDALLLNSYRPNPMSQSFFTLSSLKDTFELPILRQQSQNLEEIVLRLTEALGLWGYDKVFIYDKWLERGKKVRRYHRTLFFNLFSRGQTAPHGYKQILILWNIKYTHVPQKHRPWLNHSTCEIRIDPCYQSLTETSKGNYMLF